MTAKHLWLVAAGAAIGAVVTWALVYLEPGESFPVVFRGTTQAVTADGDGVAFHPIAEYRRAFDAFPAFDLEGENRTSAVPAEVCLAPGTGEQDVVFAVADLRLVWYACLSEGVVRS